MRAFTAGAASDGTQWQVSTAGGIHPVWLPNGKELYYIDPVGAMVAVPIAANGTSIQSGTPLVLFATRILGGGIDAGQGRQVRRRAGRAVPDQHRAAGRRYPDHAAPALASGCHAVALRSSAHHAGSAERRRGQVLAEFIQGPALPAAAHVVHRLQPERAIALGL